LSRCVLDLLPPFGGEPVGVFIEVEKAAINTEKAVKEMAHGVEQFARRALRQGDKIIQLPASFLPQFAEQLCQYGLVFR